MSASFRGLFSPCCFLFLLPLFRLYRSLRLGGAIEFNKVAPASKISINLRMAHHTAIDLTPFLDRENYTERGVQLFFGLRVLIPRRDPPGCILPLNKEC